MKITIKQNMKKIFLTIAIFITVNSFAFSQENETVNEELKIEKVKLSSKIGALAWRKLEFNSSEIIDKGWAGEIFYHQTVEENTFLSFGAIYTNQHPIIKHNIKGCQMYYLGINYRSDLIETIPIPFSNFVGLEGHLAIYKNEVNDETKLKYSTRLFVNVGASIPVVNNFSLEISTRFYWWNFTGINFGIAYLLP